MEKNRVFVINNGSLMTLVNWLKRQPIQGMKSRERSRFFESVRSQLIAVEEYRVSLVKEYAETDEKGEYIMVENGFQREFELSDENREVVEKAFAEKLKERFRMEVTPDFEKSYTFIKGFVLNTGAEFAGPEAEEYDKWCTAFERDIDETYTAKEEAAEVQAEKDSSEKAV